jgi:thiol-disulfide isomerase/thioredoxin
MLGKTCSAIALIFWLFAAGLISPGDALAQASKSGNSVEDLLKSIGLTKPAFSQAPDFNLRDAHGGISSLSGYRGHLVLLNFWATWCGPCREEMPSMETLSRNFGGQGFVVAAVNQRENAAQVNRFMKTHGLNFPAPLDTDGRVAQSYRVYGIPVTYLINGNGQAVGMKAGPKDWASAEVVSVFRKLIGESGSGSAAGSMDLEPVIPLPGGLQAKAGGTVVRSRQNPDSEAVGKLERGEEATPLGKASGAGEFWYMVKTKSGAVGWVRGADVEGVRTGK